ncbi:MAG: 5-deoxy-glucuronate isomerase [Actinomycetota bacterium]|nr:5-deoxy-glucuronate isomerase [Actinomycetota bacterium]
MTQLFYPAGTAAHGNLSLDIDATRAGWAYSGLRVLELNPGESTTFATGSAENAVLPLAGGCTVEVENKTFVIPGRDSVFTGISGFAYVPIDSEIRISSPSGGQIALCSAEATRRIAPYEVPAEAIAIEVRGGGNGTRQINNFLSADVWEADKLIAVEVITPEGGWSSYPPHKHDEMSEIEVALEEIYYFRIDGENGTGFFSAYTTDGSINETVTVRDEDTFLVPRGFHGPAAATPGHHMYYLNVMAGPSAERVWRFCDDPDHAWARSALEQLDPDPRLPLTLAAT